MRDKVCIFVRGEEKAISTYTRIKHMQVRIQEYAPVEGHQETRGVGNTTAQVNVNNVNNVALVFGLPRNKCVRRVAELKVTMFS